LTSKIDFAIAATRSIVSGSVNGGAGCERSDKVPSEAEIAEINARHLIRTPIKPADLFVFGTREDVARRVDEAARLWREGLFRWSIVGGGVTPGSSLSVRDPARRDDRAMNTGENVIFSLPVIDAALGSKNIRSVICLGNTWTARRYPMTLHRDWPEVEKMLVTVDSFATPRTLWHADPGFSRRVLGE
jgi:uncharacterized SAM-binding protein YcdF (DUF218 family)